MSQVVHNGGKTPSTGFRLDKDNGKLMGVCSGLANSFGMDPLAWRLIFVIGAIAGVGLLIPIYFAIGLLAD
ncbi:PspC domain-containing protein [Altererythrobacter salegens]|uniref:PspC domain-containing protein n=1 Tax=Croceibacterium salegens TaxID=1737568 RepID=A0A6I4SSL9_9SPHN|nr:PspC domain-containing protein [Croceibacterium salegens]MXO57977.1 PspC domain-containing protein [Croceibacterium salegens]